MILFIQSKYFFERVRCMHVFAAILDCYVVSKRILSLHHELRQWIFYSKIVKANSLYQIKILVTWYQLQHQLRPWTYNVEDNLCLNLRKSTINNIDMHTSSRIAEIVRAY